MLKLKSQLFLFTCAKIYFPIPLANTASTVWPQNFLPREGRFFGKIRNKSLGKRCIQRSLRSQGSQSQTSGPALFDSCLSSWHPGQLFSLSEAGFLMTDENLCLDAPQHEEPDSGLRFTSCSEQPRQRWEVEPDRCVAQLTINI